MAGRKKEIDRENGASFIVDIKRNEYSSWQGTVTWIESNETVSFRSAMELIRLMDSVVEKDRELEAGRGLAMGRQA
uniref:hypothetical protein n=1 Tax=Eubacterium cellulosolvens TaxID=29322 RepID=UPI0012DFBE5D|nr:hypothetical protein [[Eubacterium] cellulosolvens]